jgi:hypothetical protein
VSYLRLDLGRSATPLVPFHGFSPVIKTLFVDIYKLPPSQIFNLILSFPLLEDLTVIISRDVGQNEEGEMPTAAQPLTSPIFTGSLELSSDGRDGIYHPSTVVAPGRYPLPKAHFDVLSRGSFCWQRRWWRVFSHPRIPRYYLDMYGTSTRHLRPHRELTSVPRRVEPASIDLSKATKLKDVVFQPRSREVEWVTMALQTITSKHRDLRQISIHMPLSRPLSTPRNPLQE